MQLKGRPLWNFSLQKISMHRLFIHRVEKFRSRTSIFFQQSKSRFVGNTAGVSELFNSKKNMEFFEFEYIKGFRSNSMLLYTKDEKQIYKKTNFYNNGTRYVCYSENCGTSVFVDENERCRRLKNSQSHNHPTQEILKDKMVISQNIKEACKNASSERCSARAIFDEECRKANNSAHLVKYTQMQRNLRRIKNRVPPQKPSSPEIVNDMLSEDPLVIKCEFTEYEVSEPSYQSTIIQPKKNMEFFNFEYINGFRSNSMLVYTKDEKQIYRKTNIYNKGTRYVCYIKSCRASVFIDEYEICKKLNDSQSHNHPTQEVLKDKMIISQNIKEACKSASLKRGSTREIFDEECRKANDSAHLLQFKKMRRNLFRLKNSVLPKKPLSPENLKNMLSEEPIVANCEFTEYAPSDPLYQDTIVESKKKRKFVEFEYIKGFRSNSMLVYTKDEKQIYRKKCFYKKGTRYVCYNKKCRKSVFIDKYDRCKKLNDLSSHNHPTQELLKDTMLIRQSIKEACKNASLERCSTRDIFDEECRKANNSANLIQFGKMRRNLYRIKNSVRPKNPSSPEKLKNMLSVEPLVTNTEYELGGPSDKGTITESKKNTEFLEFEYINGFRANSKLVYTKDEKQVYKKKYSYNKGTRYVCYNKNCSASVSIDQYERCKKLNDSHSHNHPTQELLKDKMTISKNIKEACKNASSERWSTRNIFEEECRKANISVELVQFEKMRRNLSIIKNSALPKNPSSPEELKNMFSEEKIVAKYGFSKYDPGERFYQGTIIESEYSFAIFMSPTIKKLILENSHIRRSFYLDGTFGVAPSSTFEHLIIIHIEYLDHIFPFFYVMMTNKSQAAYIHMLQYINTNLIDLNPVSFMTDYEEDLRNALKSVFPLAELSGCWFHYCQAIRQSAREIPNFIVALRWNNALRRLMKKFMALPLLKPDMINTALGLLQAEVDKMPMTSTYSTISNDFIEYVKKKLIVKEGPEGISVHNASIRTTSAIEAYNSKLTMKMSKNQNIFKFLIVLLEEDFKKIPMFKSELDGTFNVHEKLRPCLYKKRSNLIRKIVTSVENEQISITDFLNKMANNQINLMDEIYTGPISEIENSENETGNLDNETGNSASGTENSDHKIENSDNEIENSENETGNLDNETGNSASGTENSDHKIENSDNEIENSDNEAENSDSETENTDNECDDEAHQACLPNPMPSIFCMGEEKPVLILPCNHVKLCDPCFHAISEKAKAEKCAYCSAIVSNASKVSI
ncbi:uncharacterized protein LOC118743463 isoform X2 [Rhagoletis pomonella]|uniref:uncharacterized protein LOC118743463 isoform X1 n=1 Tax=Rhagoletis pomonella TaxID=28610 RepID=UPI00177F199D|nr:uncharacterized protein LOC118743463 isoform X1 [Rhagoletis pomonella]XP_036332045.1 uncharacterized protein LOC118743463 isoform X2 [Rhagoletis pomonella]